MKGAFVIELFLYLLFILPGVLYTLWRYATIEKVCRVCGAPGMIPVESPEGRRLQAATRPEKVAESFAAPRARPEFVAAILNEKQAGE